ncbi:MAG TPA: chloride channel protein [Spirochaetota bacterium]|nr:chloride channel protein [Spirochaetota bacterium]HPJ33206.1 chloride channel protein [Spirochaetota bacterium]
MSKKDLPDSDHDIYHGAINGFLRLRYLDSDIFRYVYHVMISVILGIFAGSGGILFHYLIEQMRELFEPQNIRASFDINPFFIILIPVAGGLITSVMTHLYPDLAKEKGVLSVIKAVIIRKGVIPLRETVFHLIAPIISIGAGAPLGPEGPSAKIGGGIGSFMSQIFRLSSNDMIMYTSAGGGAAISAVFNAPIAGVFFGIEVILLNDLKNRALSALIIASVVADILSRAVLGNEKIFSIPAYHMGELESYPYYLALGIFCGVTSYSYFKISEQFKKIFNEKIRVFNPYLRLLPVTLIFGLFLIWNYELYGIGYSTINKVLHNNIPITELALIFILKIVFLAMFLQAGAYGGTFAPSLSIGAFLGYLFAFFVNRYFPVVIDPVAFALVGMGGVLAGINSIPLTSILLVFEVTGDYQFILPLMLVSIISYLVILYYRRGSEYTLALMDENIDVTKKGDLDIFSKISVKSILKKDMDVADYRTPFRELVRIIINARYGDIFVVNEKNHLIGIITLKDVRHALLDNDLADLLIAGDLAVKVPAVRINDPVALAIKKIREYELEIIPVVMSEHNSEFAGVITHNDIIENYFKVIEDIGMSEHLTNPEKRIKSSTKKKSR